MLATEHRAAATSVDLIDLPGSDPSDLRTTFERNPATAARKTVSSALRADLFFGALQELLRQESAPRALASRIYS